MTPADRPFDVRRVVVHAANDDEILQATRDEELAVVEEAEITGAQKGPFPRVAQLGLECGRRLIRPVPIPRSHARAGYPDLSDRVGWARRTRVGIHDDDGLAERR